MKSHPFHIPKPQGERLIVQEDRLPKFYGKYHRHTEIQISLVQRGAGKLIVSGSVHPFGPGELFVIGGGVPHVFQHEDGSGPCQMLSLFFGMDSFGTDFFGLPDLEGLDAFFDRAQGSFRLAPENADLAGIMTQFPGLGRTERFIRFLGLLHVLAQAPKEILHQHHMTQFLSPVAGERLKDVMEHVMQHYQAPIALDKVAALACMTPSSFSRFFKKRTNKTFMQFVLELRVAHACQLLSTHLDMPIYEAAERSGFSTLSHFNRKFKSIKGCTPRHFLKKQRKMTLAQAHRR
ncbi:AraC family transcriptional regulator [Maribacter sp. 2307ULW6-5]|uniref:AraC family transcriptional regulator n=1 Tax=Maribacter sp. 2307ULW6-5 TaxID=3386275 RepID=UPI0039BC85BE